MSTRLWGVGALLLTGTVTAAGACENRPNAPSAPAGPIVPTGESTVSICHRADTTSTFTLIVIAETALPAHLAHGDGQLGDPVPGQPDLKFAPDCTLLPFVPLTITFGGLSGVPNGSPVVTYGEGGFVVASVSGSWEAMTGYGKPAPAIIFKRLASEPTLTGEVRVGASGAVFGFSAIDLYSSVTTIPYTITGHRHSLLVLAVSGIVPNTFGNFATVVNPNPGVPIDTLLISLQNPAVGCCSNPVGLDNIVLRR